MSRLTVKVQPVERNNDTVYMIVISKWFGLRSVYYNYHYTFEHAHNKARELAREIDAKYIVL